MGTPTIRPPSIPFKQWASDSRTATTMFMCSLVIFLMYMLTGTQSKRVDDCKEEVKYWRHKDSVNQDIISDFRSMQMDFSARSQRQVALIDSFIHANTASQAKKILSK